MVATIEPVPIPTSVENIPRWTPIIIVLIKPPFIDVTLKASFNSKVIRVGIWLMFLKNIKVANNKYQYYSNYIRRNTDKYLNWFSDGICLDF